MPRLKTRGTNSGESKPTLVKKGPGRPRRSNKSTMTNFPTKVVKDASKIAPGMNITNQAVRWKVVKMGWRFTSDTEVAKLLLDCYDVIVSGCLKWGIDIQTTRIPSVVSDDGWNLLEEITSVMDWKARQPMKKRLLKDWPNGESGDDVKIKQELAGSNSDDDDYEGMVDDDKDEDYIPEGMAAHDSSGEAVQGGKNDGDGIAKLLPLTQKTDSDRQSQNNVMKSRIKKLRKAGTKRKSAGASTSKSSSKKKKKHSFAKGYRKSGRPKKVVEFLNTPNLPKIFECKRCKDRQTTLEDFKEHYKVHSESVAIGDTIQQLSHVSMEAIPEIAIIYITCPDCNELTSNYGVHRLKHFKQMCDLCGKVFHSFSGWRRHVKFHKAMETGEKSHVCDKCGKGFILISALTEHRRLHSKERPHTCDVCGKGFKQKAHLTRHLFIHSDVKPITCEYCGKGFTNNFNMKSHLRTHTGERPFVCAKCGKSFAHNGSLRTHMKTEHNIEIEVVCQSVQEFDDFSVPKRHSGKSKTNSTPALIIDKRILPGQKVAEIKLEQEAQKRQVLETFRTLAEGVEMTSKSSTEECENDRYRKEQDNAILTIAAVTSGINMTLQEENRSDAADKMRKSSSRPPTLHQATGAPFHHQERLVEKRMEERVHTLPTESASWQGIAHSATRNIQDSMRELRTSNLLIHRTSSVEVNSSAGTSSEQRFGIIETHVPMVSREEEVSVVTVPRLPESHENGTLHIHHPNQVIDLHVPRMITVTHGEHQRGTAHAYDSVEIPIPQIQSEQQHQTGNTNKNSMTLL